MTASYLRKKLDNNLLIKRNRVSNQVRIVEGVNCSGFSTTTSGLFRDSN